MTLLYVIVFAATSPLHTEQHVLREVSTGRLAIAVGGNQAAEGDGIRGQALRLHLLDESLRILRASGVAVGERLDHTRVSDIIRLEAPLLQNVEKVEHLLRVDLGGIGIRSKDGVVVDELELKTLRLHELEDILGIIAAGRVGGSVGGDQVTVTHAVGLNTRLSHALKHVLDHGRVEMG